MYSVSTEGPGSLAISTLRLTLLAVESIFVSKSPKRSNGLDLHYPKASQLIPMRLIEL